MTKLNHLRVRFVLFALCIAMPTVSPSATFKTLVSFNGTNGAAPLGSLVQGPNGNLYGTTRAGGKHGGGTIFEATPTGNLTTLYNFCSKGGATCTDGEYPYGTLLLATDGNFYGTTYGGGTHCASSGGCGTIFKITPAGSLTTLYNFCSKGGTLCSDGQNPEAPLIQATDGNLYGTTFYGGNATGSGTLFKITTAGKLTTLHNFCSEGGAICTDGANPDGVIQGADENFWVPTFSGGKSRFSKETGAFLEFFFASYGINYRFNFCQDPDCGDGARPEAPLDPFNADLPSNYPETSPSVVDQASGAEEFYGTTSGGGANLGGAVFKISSSKIYDVVYSFCAKPSCTDGAYPKSPVLEGTDGNLYGTTYGGDGNTKCPINQGCGTVFQLTTAGKLTTLHSFAIADGQYPYAGLVQATNGTFYGVTGLGGKNGEGTIFSVSMGLGPYVKTVPTAAKVGTTVMILGTNLMGTSLVTFNGRSAQFKVVSTTEITATIPTGATTGTVEVTTPSGTLKSWSFQIL